MLIDYTKILLFQIGAALATVVSLSQISKHIGLEIYGQYNLYLSIIGFVTMFFINWPNAALLRYGREEWNKYQRIGESMVARFILYLTGAAIAVLFVLLINPFATNFLNVHDSLLFWLILGILLMPLSEIWIYASQAVGRSITYGVVPFVSKIIFLLGLLLIPFLRTRPNLEYLITFFLAGALLSACTAFFLLPKHSWTPFRLDGTALKKILHYSWSVPFGALSSFIVNWVDAWVIRFYMDISSVGVYTWAYQVVTLAGMAFVPLGVILTPMVVDARLSGDSEKLSTYGDRSLRLVVLVGILGIILLPLVFPILNLIAGSDYKKSYTIILVLLSALPMQLLGYLINPIMNAYEFLIPKTVLISIFMAVMNVMGDLIMVPILGIMGAAITSAALFSMTSLLMVRLTTPYVSSFPSMKSFFLGGLLMPLGVLCLCMMGPLKGGVLCLLFASSALIVFRHNRLFSVADVQWLNMQPLAKNIKVPLVHAAAWLAKSKRNVE